MFTPRTLTPAHPATWPWGWMTGQHLFKGAGGQRGDQSKDELLARSWPESHILVHTCSLPCGKPQISAAKRSELHSQPCTLGKTSPQPLWPDASSKKEQKDQGPDARAMWVDWRPVLRGHRAHSTHTPASGRAEAHLRLCWWSLVELQEAGTTQRYSPYVIGGLNQPPK